MKLSSSAFVDRQPMPVKYANLGVSGGKNLSVPLAWSESPPTTKSFALSIIDRHPIARNWVHWLVINIPAAITVLAEGASKSNLPAGAMELKNTFGGIGYGGPQPPPGSGAHDYEIALYALNVDKIALPPDTKLPDFTSALQGKIMASAALVGTFER
jgi:Raf kinase inhibitor-like YbhB/YbcL family protein